MDEQIISIFYLFVQLLGGIKRPTSGIHETISEFDEYSVSCSKCRNRKSSAHITTNEQNASSFLLT